MVLMSPVFSCIHPLLNDKISTNHPSVVLIPGKNRNFAESIHLNNGTHHPLDRIQSGDVTLTSQPPATEIETPPRVLRHETGHCNPTEAMTQTQVPPDSPFPHSTR